MFENVKTETLLNVYCDLFDENFPTVGFSGNESDLRKILVGCITSGKKYLPADIGSVEV